MTYDPIDTNESDNTADANVTLNTLAGIAQINGQNLILSAENTDYEIQKNGSDGNGVINFKT